MSQPGGTFPLAHRSVARIGFGAMQLIGAGGRTAPDRKSALAVLRRALELGINHLDSSPWGRDFPPARK
jgi:aryl-alcohol dehydrogenase-like predicted oxidoreductase